MGDTLQTQAQNNDSQAVRRFRINPVELAIFSIVTLIFLNSVYNLFYDRQGFHPTTVAPMAAKPTTEGRAPASVSQTFLNLDVKCEGRSDQDTQAQKVRLTGSLCGPGGTDGRAPAGDANHLTKTEIVNQANRFTATVFTDVSRGTFSTDYIPLKEGSNPIRLEFTYDGGKVVTQEMVVNKR